MATQTITQTSSGLVTINNIRYYQACTAQVINTYSISSNTNTSATLSGTVTLKIIANAPSASSGTPHAVTCLAGVDKVTVAVQGTQKLSIGTKSVSIASKKGSTQTNSVAIGTYTVTINKTHSIQNIKVELNIKNLVANCHYASRTKDSGSLTDSTSIAVAPRPSYSIVYGANGGTSTPATQTKWYDEAITLQGAISRTGYRFSGWKWSGNNLTYTASTAWNVANASGTMTAQWSANTYTVRYNANGGSGSMSDSSHTYDIAKSLTSNTFVKTHYLFKGWATSPTGSVVYLNNQSVKNLTSTHGATINLYAVWEYKYSKPSITSLTAYRTTHEVDPSSATRHKKDDAGNYADIEVAVNVGQEKSIAGGTFSPTNTTVEFFYKPYNDPQQPNFINLNLSQQISTNGSVIVNTINSNLNLILSTEQQYEILIKAYVTATGVNGPDLATRETFISTAYFLVDMTENAIAFGQAVTDPNCFTCNMDEKLIGKLLLNTQAEDGKLFTIGVTDAENVDVGWSYSEGHGAGAGFRSADHGNAGQFAIYARSGPSSTQTSTLIGTPAGALTWNGTSIVQTSDRRLKKHQAYLSTEAIQFVQKLNPAFYKKNDMNQIGFYAQDIEQIDPWNCLVGESEGYKTLNYIGMIAPLVTYCQYLEKRIDKLEAELKK